MDWYRYTKIMFTNLKKVCTVNRFNANAVKYNVNCMHYLSKVYGIMDYYLLLDVI